MKSWLCKSKQYQQDFYKKIKGEIIMTLYEEFKEKYLKDYLIDFFIEKRKFILENNKKDYLNYLIKEGLLEEDITNVAKMSLDLFIAQAQAILIHDKEIVETYSKLNKKKNLCYLVKSIKNFVVWC